MAESPDAVVEGDDPRDPTPRVPQPTWLWSSVDVMQLEPAEAARSHAYATTIARFVRSDGTKWLKSHGRDAIAGFVLERGDLRKLRDDFRIVRRKLDRHREVWRSARLSHDCGYGVETLFVVPFEPGRPCPGCRDALPDATPGDSSIGHRATHRRSPRDSSPAPETAHEQRERAASDKGLNEGRTQGRGLPQLNGRGGFVPDTNESKEASGVAAAAHDAAARMVAWCVLEPDAAIRRAAEIPDEKVRALADRDADRVAILDAEARAFVENSPREETV
jgi:hypothetical protein